MGDFVPEIHDELSQRLDLLSLLGFVKREVNVFQDASLVEQNRECTTVNLFELTFAAYPQLTLCAIG